METAKEKGGRGQGSHEHQQGRNKITVAMEGRNSQTWPCELMDGKDQGRTGWEWRSAEAI